MNEHSQYLRREWVNYVIPTACLGITRNEWKDWVVRNLKPEHYKFQKHTLYAYKPAILPHLILAQLRSNVSLEEIAKTHGIGNIHSLILKAARRCILRMNKNT